MSEINETEEYLVKATGYKPKRNAKRQDYLAGLARAVEQIDQDTFDNFNDDAANWYDKAAKAINKGEDIPDFEEPEDEEEPEQEEAEDADDAADNDSTPDDDEEDETEEESEDDESDDESEPEEEEPEAETALEPDEEAEPEPAPKKAKAKPKAKPAAVEKPAPKVKAKANSKAPPPVDLIKEGDEELVKAVAKQREKDAKVKPGSKKAKEVSLAPGVTGKKDKWGVFEGTKTADALKDFEKGATMRSIKEYFGDTQYNLLRRLREEGHLVEKTSDGKFKITHKDELKGKSKK